MRFKSVYCLPIVVLGLMVLTVSCAREAETDGAMYVDEVFGNGQKDITQVIAKVGDLEITQKDFDLRFAELSDKDKRHFSGEAGHRDFLEEMVADAILYREAMDAKLYLDPDVAQRLIALKRLAMVAACKNLIISENIEPTKAEIRQHYEDNKEKYVVQGKVRARHIETATREKAQAAYDKIMSGEGRESLFNYVAGDMSENKKTAKDGGHIGWFNRGGVVPYVSDGPEFSNLVYDWEIGLHEPVKIGDRWHVIEILERIPDRQKTINEAHETILQELRPILQKEKTRDLVAQRKKDLNVQLLGEYTPGGGRTPKELYKLGLMAKTFSKQEQYLLQLADDFPESDYAPKALFMLANAFMDNYSDKRNARINLYRLITDYPDCDLYDDAKYMMDNLNKAEFVNPQTIEELRGE